VWQVAGDRAQEKRQRCVRRPAWRAARARTRAVRGKMRDVRGMRRYHLSGASPKCPPPQRPRLGTG